MARKKKRSVFKKVAKVLRGELTTMKKNMRRGITPIRYK